MRTLARIAWLSLLPACAHPWSTLAPCDTSCTDSLHLVAPLSGADVTTAQPTFHWQPTGVRVRFTLCSDAACARTIDGPREAEGNTRPTTALATGTYYWRVSAGAQDTPIWSVRVGTAAAAADGSTVDSSWGNPLDLDRDGHDEIAVGAPMAGSGTGRVVLYAPDATTHRLMQTATAPHAPSGASYFGQGVASAGDVDGDGFGDLVVGALGRAAVYAGGPTGLRSSEPVTVITPPAMASAQFGRTAAGIGDVDGDGYADVAVGAPDPSGTGHLFVYAGGPGGVSAQPSVMLGSATTRDTASSLGTSFAGAGDLDGDGYHDVVAGGGDERVANPGSAFVYRGSAHGLIAVPAWIMRGASGDAFGASVDGGGDVNGDGRADLVLGSPLESGGAGAVYVLVYTNGGFVIDRFAAPDGGTTHFGAVVAMLGDVDGDGLADFAALGETRGTVHVFRGRADHRRGSPSASTLTRSFSLSITGGPVVSLAGTDPDGDGRHGLLIGSPGAAHAWYYAPDGSGLTASDTLTAPSASEGFGAALAFATRSGLRDAAWTL